MQTSIICHWEYNYHSNLFTSNTGPAVQTQRLPFEVFSTQQRHAPNPHAIRFSKEASQRILFACAYFATETIIGLGPQVEI